MNLGTSATSSCTCAVLALTLIKAPEKRSVNVIIGLLPYFSNAYVLKYIF